MDSEAWVFLGGVVLLAIAYETVPAIGAPLTILVLLGLLATAANRGYIK